MAGRYLIGLDYGTESARGVLIDAETGAQVASHTVDYPNGVMTRMRDGAELPRGWALQDASDYLVAAREILTVLGTGKHIESIGIDFTASSPMPAHADGRALSQTHPDSGHAYVKLWKHASAQHFADAINARGGDFLTNFGGKVSGEWLLAKAAELAREAPDLWAQTDRFIEAGDWVVWQLTGQERRSLAFAAYKAQYDAREGYPTDAVDGLEARLSAPFPIGTSAGRLDAAWRADTGIEGPCTVAVAVIDSHAVLPAVGGVRDGCLVAALGTSAVYLHLSSAFKPLPPGIEGVAKDASVAGFWCYEAGQAGFGDTLAWFARTFPRGAELSDSFAAYNAEAAELAPGAGRLVALDWWSGNRVPLADTKLSGLLVGLDTHTTAAQIYRALMEALCFGARSVVELFEAGGLPVEEMIVTSGLAASNPLLVQILADVLGKEIRVPEIDNATAVGAAIHGAVAGGVVAGFADGAERFGARSFRRVSPVDGNTEVYAKLYSGYRALAETRVVRDVMHDLAEVEASAGKQSAGRRSVA
ncbi:FGGY-family carbohydrate kinase [Nitratireductor sp. GCM10026969]|uniref:FGGY-family carbohydrate kinase n=1 Tax=Nitratireductor sp. GCM10026969 TaxID=3252645 RepID=UPI0036121AC9